MKNCVFCNIFSHKHDNHTYNIVPKKTLKNLVITETPKFFITLDISPIADNHCLIVIKRHITAFTLLEGDEWPEFNRILKDVRKKFFGIYGFKPTIFEHGTIHKQALLSGCMEHAHIHVLPLMNDVSTTIERDGFELAGKGRYDEMYHKFQKDSYLYYENHKNRSSFYNVQKMPSQYLRKILSKSIGKKNWNWKIRVNSLSVTELSDELIRSHEFLTKHLSCIN